MGTTAARAVVRAVLWAARPGDDASETHQLARLLLVASGNAKEPRWADLLRRLARPGGCAPTIETALSERAEAVGLAALRRMCAPSTHSEPAATPPVQSVWDALKRTAKAVRSNKRRTMQLPQMPEAVKLRAASGQGSQHSSSAVGRLTCDFSEPSPPALPAWPATSAASSKTGARIQVWRPPLRRAPPTALQQLLPPRAHASALESADLQHARQLERISAWRLGDHVPEAACALLQPGPAMRHVKAWAKQRRRAYSTLASTALPAAVACKILTRTEIPTLLASSGGHCWTVTRSEGPAPADLAQYAAMTGLLAHLPDLQRVQASRAVTAVQLRALLGQGVHGAATRLIGARTLQRVPAKALRRPWTAAAICCGMDTLTLALLPLLPAGSRKAWAVDACTIAARAHEALWRGAATLHIMRAEAAALRCATWHVDMELVTPRCAPFSPANRLFPAGCWAALRELEAILAGTAARRPRVVVYENTAGLWRTPVLRACVEEILQRILHEYDWEAALVSPHENCSEPARRRRVFYMGVLRTLR